MKEMKIFIFLLPLVAGSHAAGQDLSGRLISIPANDGKPFVQLTPAMESPISAMTMCMRFFSVLTRAQTLFSLATPSQDNDLLLFKPSAKVYRLHVRGGALDITEFSDNVGGWNSVCWTWDSGSGLTVLWVNGKRSSRKLLQPGALITGTPSIILGQEQDTYGGGFNRQQSFEGDITDVHFWNEVISPCEINFYTEGTSFVHGNILNWKDLQYTTTGKVFVEKSDFDRTTCF